MLIRKMLRDVWKNKVPFVAIFLMMFAGNFIFSGITSEYNGMNKSFHSFIEETNLADVWVTSNGFNSTDIQTLKDDKNISNVEQRLLLNATLSNNSEKSVDLYVLDNTNAVSYTHLRIKKVRLSIPVWLIKTDWKSEILWSLIREAVKQCPYPL